VNSVETVEIEVPKGTKAALSDKHYPHWHEVTWKELAGLYDMDCIEYVSIDDPRVKKAFILPSHFVYNIKFSADVPPTFLKCKGRAVVGGNCEPAPENAFENFSPTAGPCINRLFDAYCVYMGFTIWSTDCAQAFLNSPTGKRNIFVRPPPGCGRPGLIWRLRKFLYGLCSAPAAWMETLSKELMAYGFVCFDDDPCLLRLKKGNSEIIAEVFVDDIKWGSNDEELLKTTIASMEDNFTTTGGDTPATSSNKDEIDWTQAIISTYLGM
jgi:hypothetical protein